MKTIHAYLVTSALVLGVGSAAMVGCGSSDDSSTDGSAGTSSSNGGATTSNGGSTTSNGGSATSNGGKAGAGGSTTSNGGKAGAGGSTTSNGGMTGAGGASAALSCEAYCSTIMANCTADNQQFTKVENCVASCMSYPVGKADDKAGNTLGCRTYHAGAAKGDPATHCPHAGPSGDATCGDPCDGYCQIAMAACTGMNQVYTSTTECQSACKAKGMDVRYNVSVMTGDEVSCLVYHAQEATLDPMSHCKGDLGDPVMTPCQKQQLHRRPSAKRIRICKEYFTMAFPLRSYVLGLTVALVACGNSDTTLPASSSAGGSASGGSGGAVSSAFVDACMNPAPTGELPCSITEILKAKCQSCHQAPPINGAHFPLITYADTHAAFGITGQLRWQRMSEVIEPDAVPHMPLKGAPQLTDTEHATLRSWFTACAPSAPTGMGCDTK